MATRYKLNRSELPAPLHSPNIYELAARRAKAGWGTKTKSEDDKETKANSHPRFRKNVYVPGLDGGLNLPYWSSSATMKIAQIAGNLYRTIIGIPVGAAYEAASDITYPAFRNIHKSKGEDEYKKNDYDDTEESMSQNAYLMTREGQRKAMEQKGYVYKGNSDENFDKTFVGKQARHDSLVKGYTIDTYQTQPDEVKEETWPLIPRNDKRSFFYRSPGWGHDILFANKKAELPHAGTYPLHFEVDSSGHLYIQGDDVNDYQTAFGFNVLNNLGRPHVVTTGPRALSLSGRHLVLGEYDDANSKDEQQKYNIDFRGKESPLVSYLKDPNNNLVLMDAYTPRVGYALPELVVRPNGKNYFMAKKWDFNDTVKRAKSPNKWIKRNF